MIINTIFTHNLLYAKDCVWAEWLCEQVFEISEVVVHVYFRRIEVYANNQNLRVVPLSEGEDIFMNTVFVLGC